MVVICELCQDAAEPYGDLANELCAEEVALILQDFGNKIADHLCDEIESDGEIECACECKGARKRELRTR